MSNQDWNTVIIRRKSPSVSHEDKKTECVTKQKGNYVKDVDIHENGPEAKITPELRKKLCDARNGREFTQSDLLKKAGAVGKKITLREIQDAEMGKCTMKQAKQIALIYQKVTGVNILAKK